MPEDKENKVYITDAHLVETGPREKDDPRAFNGAKLVTKSFIQDGTNPDGTPHYNWTIELVPDTEVEPAKEKDNFIMVRQDNTINALARTSSKANIEQMDFTGTGIIKATNGSTDIQVIIEEYANITLKPSTSKLLRMITGKFTQTNNIAVNISLKEYMELTGRKDEKEARKDIKADLKTLFNISCSAKGKIDGKKASIDFRILQAKGTIEKSCIIAKLSDDIATHLLNCPVMPYPTDMFKIPNKYPYAYYLGDKITELMKYNQHKPYFVVSVKTLLESCCFNNGMPTYEEVRKTDRRIDIRIITPFINNLDACNNIFDWHFCNSKGVPLTEEQLNDFTYKEFEARYIKITFKEYPEVEVKNIKKHKETIKSKDKKEKKKTA